MVILINVQNYQPNTVVACFLLDQTVGYFFRCWQLFSSL